MESKRASIQECQASLLELLLFVDQVCNELKVEYWLDGGTLLGAARQNDFIPWDDDIDINVWYDDFAKIETLNSRIEKDGFR